MASVFTKVLQGELPGRQVYQDELCFAMLTIAPLQPGHTLVIPIQEIDHWIDLPAELNAHLFGVAQRIARAMQETFQPAKVGMMIAGLEVRHTHIHLVPIHQVHDLDFSKQDRNPDPAMLEDAMQRLRLALEWQPK